MRKDELSYRSEAYIRAVKNFVWKIFQTVFRIDIVGIENVPRGPCLLIANHNSGAVIESHSLLFALFEKGFRVFGLNHPSLFKIPFVAGHFRKIGAVSATREASKEVLQNGSALLIFPGGNRQAFRPFSQRHNHDFPWAKGWSEIAAESKVPVVPVKFLGTHQINPIFISSQAVSKALVLPWILGVKWFPVSLSQLILAMATALGLSALGVPAFVTGLVTYLVFCFTPLIPILPARVQIRIYPPISSEHQTAEEIRNQMSGVMNKADEPRGPKRIYPLNGIERFMFLHETDKLFYNSHFVFYFEGPVDRKRFLETTEKWIQALPQIRSVIRKGLWRSQRYSYDTAWFQASDIVQFEEGISQEKVDSFCQRQFRLALEPAVRFLILSENNQVQVVFSCHHSLFDGAAQAFAFEEWSRLYNGESIKGKYQDLNTFRYRSVWKFFGWRKTLELFKENLSLTPPRMKFDVASLIAEPGSPSRKVKAQVLKFRLPTGLRDQFYEKALKALHQTLEETGDPESPIIAYMPIGLRWVLKVKNSLSNVVVSHTLFVKRSVFRDGSLIQKIETRLKSNVLESNSKFIFGCLPVCTFGNEKNLKTQFADLDHPKSPITSSILLVSAPIPRGYELPEDWKGVFISARGTLLKSPAVGLVYTGRLGFETVTLEYVEGLVSEETISKFRKNFERELDLAIDDRNESALNISL